VTKYLITGSNGFIGSRLCSTMVEKGLLVRAVVRKRDKICQSPLVECVVVEDCSSSTDWSFALTGIDVIIHLAARVHVMKETSSDPLSEFRRVNVEGTKNLAFQASRAGVARIVYLSTIKVNGEQTFDTPFSEDSPIEPQDSYALSKWEAEVVLNTISASSGMEHVIIRTPLVYGPGVKGNLRRLLNQINRGIPLPLGNIMNERSLISLDNLVDVLILASTRAECAGQTFLVSDGQDLSTTELVGLIKVAMGKRKCLFPFPNIFFSLIARLIPSLKPSLDRLTGSLVIDSSRFREKLEWSPPQTICAGINSMVSHYCKMGKYVS
jgi:nucleoside-diphosphate-sugar epimerase